MTLVTWACMLRVTQGEVVLSLCEAAGERQPTHVAPLLGWTMQKEGASLW